jgi:hypothetical protein
MSSVIMDYVLKASKLIKDYELVPQSIKFMFGHWPFKERTINNKAIIKTK